MRIGMTITKSCMFRAKEQEFHNTYYYTLPTAITAPSETLVDEVVATEKKLHSTDVTFKRAQVWTAGGTQAENQMIFQKVLTGTGSGSSASTFDRERAVLVQAKAGFDTRGKQVYLRKWYHSCGGVLNGLLNAAGVLANTSPIPAADLTTISTYANEQKEVGVSPEFWSICAKSGRLPTSDFAAYKWLEHHQLGDMWR